MTSIRKALRVHLVVSRPTLVSLVGGWAWPLARRYLVFPSLLARRGLSKQESLVWLFTAYRV
jgi:hypothetical protein